MKRLLLLAIFIFVVLSNMFSQVYNNQPHIIRTVPEFGDCSIDTSLTEIQLEFDQDMGPGYSIIDGPNMVPITGKPVWKTSRILTVPVKLNTNKLYAAYLNSDGYRNFTNQDGIPMNGTYVIFHTKNNQDVSQIDTALNISNFDNFCSYFLKHYSYKNLRGINWLSEMDSAREELIHSKSNSEFGIKILKLVRKSMDPHMTVIINKVSYNVADFRIMPNSMNFNDIVYQLTNLQQGPNWSVLTGKFDNTGYLWIPSLDTSISSDISFAIEKVKQMKDLPFLIFDLRYNGGGNEELAKSFVSMLLSNPITYEKDMLFNDSTGLFDKKIEKSIDVNSLSIKYKGRIFVITNGYVASSAESFVLMLKQMSNVKIFGSKTYGSSGNPVNFNITDSVSVSIPSWLAYDMNDSLIEGNGIEPDVKLEYPESNYNVKDPIIETILDTIKLLPLYLYIEEALVWNNPANISYGTALSSTELNATANVPGKFIYSPKLSTILKVGNDINLNVTFIPTDTVHFITITKTVKINVLKAKPAIAWNNPASIKYGTPLGNKQLNAFTGIQGTFVYSPPATTILNAGSGISLQVTFFPTDTANISSVTKTVKMNVLKISPILSWSTPEDIEFGTMLGDTQLNASANVNGTFIYMPPSKTILDTGSNQFLKVTFLPDDTTDYISIIKTVSINVFLSTGIPSISEKKIVIYPVPVLNTLIISNLSAFGNGKPLIAEILSVDGRKVLNVRISDYTDKGFINVSTLPAGMFLLRISDAENTVCRRFVKLKEN